MNDDSMIVIATFLSAIATFFAAFAAWNSPRYAAKLAESLRCNAEKHNERQRQKLHVFAMLMQERAQIYSDNGVRALNLIDIVFNESREVREAWSELYNAFHMKPLIQHVIDERLRKLLGAISDDIGLSDKLRNDDFGRIYYPVVQEQERLIKDMQRQQILAGLQGKPSAAATAPALQNTVWPPKPD